MTWLWLLVAVAALVAVALLGVLAEQYRRALEAAKAEIATVRAATAKAEQQWQAEIHSNGVQRSLLESADQRNKELREECDRLLDQLVVPAVETITTEQREVMLSNLCAHCGGVHTQACPRVKRLRFRADGQSVEEVEFWPDGRWDASRVRWLEDIPEAEPAEQ